MASGGAGSATTACHDLPQSQHNNKTKKGPPRASKEPPSQEKDPKQINFLQPPQIELARAQVRQRIDMPLPPSIGVESEFWPPVLEYT